MTDQHCKDCKEFQRLFGGMIGGGERCTKDTTPDRKKVHAMDYACDNIEAEKKETEQ